MSGREVDFSNPAKVNMRILIAEDDLTARTILAGILKKRGYDVVAVNDGQAAWEVLQQPDAPVTGFQDLQSTC